MTKAVAGFLIVAIVVLVAKLALAPFHRVYTADQCRAAYASARTRADTIEVDFKPFDDRDNSVDTRCWTVRGARAISSADLIRR